MIKTQKVLILLFCLLTIKINVLHSIVKLSEQAEISILTCSEGDELYSAFGHSAIRIKDKVNKIDLVFNYGVFDFNTPNFYLKFANGKLNYQLSASDYNRFMYSYMRENRSVKEQMLNLKSEEKQVLFAALVENIRPENRYYKYDFFYDNCATRVFYMVKDNMQGDLIMDHSDDPHKTFREYLHYYLIHSPWIETGLKVILGMPADKVASLEQSAFLPEFLFSIFKNANIKYSNGKKNLIKKENVLLEREEINESQSFIPSPFLFFTVILLIFSMLPFVLKNKTFIINLFYRIILFSTGMAGLLILYLWFVTDHSVTANNLNILWCFPGLLVLSCIRWNNSKLARFLTYIHAISLVVFLIGWKFLPQDFPVASIPFSLLLVCILYYIYYQSININKVIEYNVSKVKNNKKAN